MAVRPGRSIPLKFILQSLHSSGKKSSHWGRSDFCPRAGLEEIPKLMRNWGLVRYAQREDAWEETEEERVLGREVDLKLTEGKGFGGRGLALFLSGHAWRLQPLSKKSEKNLTIRPNSQPAISSAPGNPKKNYLTCPVLDGRSETGPAGGTGVPWWRNRGRELDEGMDLGTGLS